MAPQLLDGLSLLVQVAGLQEVAQVRVVLGGGQLVQVEQALVDGLLQVQSALHGLEAALPVSAVRLTEVPETEAAPVAVLQVHQALDLRLMRVRTAQEEVGEALQGHVVPVEVQGRGQVHVGGVDLQVDLTVDAGLAVWVVVLAHR